MGFGRVGRSKQHQSRDRVRRLCYYVSDHGWGHATRSIAVIRELLAQDADLQVIIKVDYALTLMRTALPHDRVSIARCRKDFGIALRKDSLQVDRSKTRDLFSEWIASWERFVETEERFCRDHKIGLIVSDIAPQPFLVADALQIPSIAISNFTWYGMYRHLFGEISEMQLIREAYSRVHLALVLPLAEPDLPFHRQVEIGLVARRPTMSRQAVRSSLGLSEGDRLVYVGVGGIAESERVTRRLFEAVASLLQGEGLHILLSANVDSPSVPRTILVHRMPIDTTETQNYIAACDLIISKSGYSTVAEAILGRVPILLMERDEISEDKHTLQTLESLRIAERISEYPHNLWLEDLSAWLEACRQSYKRLSGRYLRDGNAEAAARILSMSK